MPAIDPPRFDSTADVIGAVNDLACRFLDGSGQPFGRGPSEGCILSATGDLGFVDPSSTIQFCSLIGKALEFPPGDTHVTVRLLDVSGNPGARHNWSFMSARDFSFSLLDLFAPHLRCLRALRQRLCCRALGDHTPASRLTSSDVCG